MRRNLVTNIQVLRGIAALAVVGYHVGQRLPRYSDLGSYYFAEFGRAGVDLFFVISGFIMVYITGAAYGAKTDWAAFCENRCTRILPLYWIISSVVLVVFLSLPGLVNSSSSGAPNVVLSYLLIPNHSYFLLSVGWTLSHEFFFYFLFALCGALYGRHGIVATCSAIVSLVLIGWTYRLLLPTVSLPILNTATDSINLGFVYGMLCAVASKKEMRFGVAAIMIGGFIFASYAFVPQIGEHSTYFQYVKMFRGIEFGLPSALLVYGALSFEQRGKMLPGKWLGDASYSLYLIQILILNGVGAMFGRMLNPYLLMIVWFAACSAVAWLVWRYVEVPSVSLARMAIERIKNVVAYAR